MTPASPRARPRVVAAALLAVLVAPCIGTPVSHAQERQGNAQLVRGDPNVALHRKLSENIRDFQDTWRKAWRSAEMKRHRPIDLSALRGWNVLRTGSIEEPTWVGDRAAQVMTPDLRRYESILCYIGTPTDQAIEAAKYRLNTKIGLPGTKNDIDSALTLQEQKPPKKGGAVADDPNTAKMRTGAGTHKPATVAKALSGVSGATPRQIKATPDYGAVCPSWNPPDLPLQLDEGEAIDLALPPNAREPVRRQRETLIAVLQAAQVKNPNDDWIAGQLVRFVYDQRAPQRTLEVARTCVTGSPTCLALMGLAFEQGGNIVAAESAYHAADSVTARTVSDTAGFCVDREALLLLSEIDRSAFKNAPCEKQRTLLQQMWWLADPLWSVPGNERYVAHESRQTTASLRAINDRDERYVWARDGGGLAMREMVVRYGWPGYTYWPGIVLEEEINLFLENLTTRAIYLPHTAVEYSSDRTSLLPAVSAIVNPFSLTQDNYQLNIPEGKEQDEWWPQEHMMLYNKLWPMSPGQDAQWRRDNTISFQLAIDDPLRGLDTVSTGNSKAVLMGGYSPTDTRAFMSTAVGAGHTLRLNVELEPGPVVLSAEILPRSLREHAQRLRYAVRPPSTLHDMKPNDVAISPPLFMRMPNRAMEVPNDEKNVLRYMAGGLSFTRAEPLGVYWESYNFKPGDSVQVSMTVRRDDDVNVARRIGSAIGIVSALRDSIAVKWTEPDARHGALVVGGAKPVVGRSVALDLHALPAGNYVIIIEMKKGPTTAARSERAFVIRER